MKSVCVNTAFPNLRVAVRALFRHRTLTSLVVMLLAVGLSTSILAFIVLNAVMFRPLPVRDPQHLYRVVTVRRVLGPRSQLPYSTLLNLRRARYFSDAFGTVEWTGALRSGSRPAKRVQADLVTENYFVALGVQPALGRLLGPKDKGAALASAIPAVLSHKFWRGYFDGDPNIVGQHAWLNGASVRIVGVLPRAFNGISVESGADVRLPLTASRVLSRQALADPESLFL